jgi:phosphomannomutase
MSIVRAGKEEGSANSRNTIHPESFRKDVEIVLSQSRLTMDVPLDKNKEYLTMITPHMTAQQMKEYYIYQTFRSLEAWEEQNGYRISENPPFDLQNSSSTSFLMTPEIAHKINLRKQVEDFAKESQVSTAGVRENQNVLCPWDHRYRINEYIFALIAESLSAMVKELHEERMMGIARVSADEVRKNLGAENMKLVEEIYGMKLGEIIDFVIKNPVRIVGGEVRANTPRFIDLVSRIYAANGLYVFLMESPENRDTSSIFMWSYLIFILGLSGGNYFTSSHGAPQKQSDKILSFDGSQYLPNHYVLLVKHMTKIMDEIEAKGYTFKLAAKNDPHLMHRLTYERVAKLYANYLRVGPASPHALELIHRAAGEGLRLKLDFFGGCGYRTISSVFRDLGILEIFDNGFIRTDEDPFFHNIGFKLAPKKSAPHELEVIHLSVDASLKQVVETAGYGEILKDAQPGQVVYNVDPDADRFVAGQVVPSTEKKALDELGINYMELPPDKLFAIYSPNQLFLMIADNDMVQAQADGSWKHYSNFDIHTYVSALSWDEWAEHNGIPVLRVPVGFKEIAAIERKVEEAMAHHKGESFDVENELGQAITLGAHPKLHHAGEESGGKIGGPRVPIYNLLGEFVIAMREKSSGEAAFSAVALQSRLFIESLGKNRDLIYLHTYLRDIFRRNAIANSMEFRGDIIHYNEAIIDPAELAKAKAEGIGQRDVFNHFFREIAVAYRAGDKDARISLDDVRRVLIEALPHMKDEWESLRDIDLWSDGLQMWFKEGCRVRDICLRASGTDAKSKVYFDGSDKDFLKKLYAENFENFTPRPSALYLTLIKHQA